MMSRDVPKVAHSMFL